MRSSGGAPLLEIDNLSIGFNLYGEIITAVDDVSFTIESGSVMALVGESGSGKTTIGQAILGILPRAARISAGHIRFHGLSTSEAPHPVDIAALDRTAPALRHLRGRHIGMIFQEPMTSLSPLHTIGDQVSEAWRLHHGRDEQSQRTLDMLRLVGFPDPERAYRSYPFELSGGLRQRAMIAMALICHPSLLIADEPTTALDVTIQAQILSLLGDLQQRLGMAVLIITHDLGIVAETADKIVVLYAGRVMESGSRRAIFTDPRHPYLKALLHSAPRFNMEPEERLVPLRDIKVNIDALKARPPVAVPAGTAALDIADLCKNFQLSQKGWFEAPAAPLRAVSDVSFSVVRGECLGLVGESGCGKTTTAKMIMRAFAPSSGQIRFDRGDGQGLVDIQTLRGAALGDYRRDVQFIFQDPFSSLNPRMTVYDILSEPFDIHGIDSDDDASDRAAKAARVQALMHLVGLDPRFLRRYPHSFSGGQRQRIGIARALALNPQLILCDEPVSALDVSVQAQILNLLRDLKEKLGLTYLFISHNLAVVSYIADRVIVMCGGYVVEEAPARAFFTNPVHPYSQALLRAIPEPRLDVPPCLDAAMGISSSNSADWPSPHGFTVGTPTFMREIAPDWRVRVALA